MTDPSNTYELLVEQETLIADAAELICQVMEDKGINRQELATRLGKTKGFVSQILTGERNMTLRTLADVLFALGHRFELVAKPLTAPRTYAHVGGWSPARRALAPDDWRLLLGAKSEGCTDVPRIGFPLTTFFESMRASPNPGDAETGHRAHEILWRSFERAPAAWSHVPQGRSDRAAGDPSDPRAVPRYQRVRT